MSMRLGQAGHQRRAATVYDLCAVRLELVAAFCDGLDPVSLDQHLAGKQRRARSIEYRYVYEQFLTHRTLHRTDRLRLGGPDKLSHSVRWYWHAVDTDTEGL